MKIKNLLIALCCFVPLYGQNKTAKLAELKKEIVLGMSGSFSGHFTYYGNAIKHAIQARFERINKAGGIQGNMLKLVALDDAGNAEQTKANIDTLMGQGITMFVGVMGTRGVLSILPLVKDKKIALFFPWAGDPQLQDKSLTNIINGPGMLHSQLATLAKHIGDTLKLKKVAIFHADDEFSAASAQSLIAQLAKYNIKPLGVEEYNRFTMDIAHPTARLIEKDPRVVVSIGTNVPTQKMINQFFEQGLFGTYFMGIDSTFLVKDILHYKGVRFNFTSLVPDPVTSTIELAKEYRDDMALYFPDEGLSILSFEYYAAASIITFAMQKITSDITKEKILQELEAMKKTTVLGFPIDFDPANRHIFGQQVWIV